MTEERQSADEGKLVEKGWESFRLLVIPINAPDVQVDSMRKAFYCGAHHLFNGLLEILDPGDEPTEEDERRLQLVAKELDNFRTDLLSRVASMGTQ